MKKNCIVILVIFLLVSICYAEDFTNLLDQFFNAACKEIGQIAYYAALERDKGNSLEQYLNSSYIQNNHDRKLLVKDKTTQEKLKEIFNDSSLSPKKAKMKTMGYCIDVSVEGRNNIVNKYKSAIESQK